MEIFVILCFHVGIPVKYHFQGKKTLAIQFEEQLGELFAFCKQAISVSQGTAENGGS